MSLLFRRTFFYVLLIGGIVVIAWCLTVINSHLGAEVAGVSVLATPVLVIALPWWSALADGNWMPLVWVYGWLGVCFILYELSRSLKSLEKWH